MPTTTQGSMPRLISLQLQDFGQLQQRYLAMGLAKRAATVLSDAEPALRTAERILGELEDHDGVNQAFDNIRKNVILTGKMRASEAKTILMDNGNFIEDTRHKLAAWVKTMERLSGGEGIANDKGREYIPHSTPLALAIIGNATPGNFLSIIQLAIVELGKIDDKNAGTYISLAAEMRRCATLLSDCEHASAIHAIAH